MTELWHAPASLTHAELVEVVEDFGEGVRTGDTLEGFLEITIGDMPDRFDVRARYRTGNLLGQGGYRMVGEFRER